MTLVDRVASNFADNRGKIDSIEVFTSSGVAIFTPDARAVSIDEDRAGNDRVTIARCPQDAFRNRSLTQYRADPTDPTLLQQC